MIKCINKIYEGDKMITIGLTGWSDHDLLTINKKNRLENYSSHFPFVELDTSFYAIPSEKNVKSWIDKTPELFKFIPKAFSGMTLHSKYTDHYGSVEEMFDIFKTRFYPMLAAKKIKTFLFQFPPFFHCNANNVEYLLQVKDLMGPLPIAIEFRHQSWFNEENKENTLRFLKEHFYIHTVVDQPQTPSNSVPSIIEVTNKKLSIYRLHGRNYSGWLNASEDPAWRANRTLHDYSSQELLQIKENSLLLERSADEVAIIFNNNSGGHAAKNAKELQEMLGLEFEGLYPMQLDLF